MIEEKVKEMLSEAKWTFADLQDMNTVVKGMVEVLHDELSAKEKLDMIWESETTEVLSYNTLDDELIPMPFGVMFQGLVKDKLTASVIEIVKKALMNANVNFNKEEDENEDEISEGSVVGKPHKKSPSDKKKNSE